MSATLTVTEVGPSHHRYLLDCPHAVSTVDYFMPSVGGVSQAEILDVLRIQHEASCHCADVIRIDEEAVA